MLTGISACSSQKTFEPQTEDQVVTEIQSELSEASEPPNIAQTTEQAGFVSPQSAVKAYLEGLKSSDFKRMAETFAEEMHLDDILRQYTVLCQLELNTDSYIQLKEDGDAKQFMKKLTFTRGFNIQSRKEEIIRDTVKQYAAVYNINEGYFKKSTLLLDEDISDENISSKIMELLDQLDLSSMKILGHIPPEELSEEYGSNGRMDIRAQHTKVCGADNVESCVAIFELEGNKYCFCFDAVQYKDKWYIRQLGGSISTLLDIPSDLAGIMPIDALEKPEVEKLIIPIT
ncbi:hypothetical protein [Lacrimispora sp.]|uniref:hypothetical protein n=1 Tax=Lacrimispora sp. TaxID=2719234 RepID=UPI0028B039AF|nr:hypothetical protein [Lacrimispora sp.]